MNDEVIPPEQVAKHVYEDFMDEVVVGFVGYIYVGRRQIVPIINEEDYAWHASLRSIMH